MDPAASLTPATFTIPDIGMTLTDTLRAARLAVTPAFGFTAAHGERHKCPVTAGACMFPATEVPLISYAPSSHEGAKIMRMIMLASAGIFCLGIGSAAAESEGGQAVHPNTTFTTIPGVVAEAPAYAVSAAEMASYRTYAARQNHGTWLFPAG
jgi:hypothetical protein